MDIVFCSARRNNRRSLLEMLIELPYTSRLSRNLIDFPFCSHLSDNGISSFLPSSSKSWTMSALQARKLHSTKKLLRRKLKSGRGSRISLFINALHHTTNKSASWTWSRYAIVASFHWSVFWSLMVVREVLYNSLWNMCEGFLGNFRNWVYFCYVPSGRKIR